MPGVPLMRAGRALRRALLPSPSHWESTHIPLSTPRELCLRKIKGTGGRNGEKMLFILMVRSKALGEHIHIQKYTQTLHLRLFLGCLLNHVKRHWGDSRQQPSPSFPCSPGSDFSCPSFKNISASVTNPLHPQPLLPSSFTVLGEKCEIWVPFAWQEGISDCN